MAKRKTSGSGRAIRFGQLKAADLSSAVCFEGNATLANPRENCHWQFVGSFTGCDTSRGHETAQLPALSPLGATPDCTCRADQRRPRAPFAATRQNHTRERRPPAATRGPDRPTVLNRRRSALIALLQGGTMWPDVGPPPLRCQR
jgi:hypothetical protein